MNCLPGELNIQPLYLKKIQFSYQSEFYLKRNIEILYINTSVITGFPYTIRTCISNRYQIREEFYEISDILIHAGFFQRIHVIIPFINRNYCP
jgi:hypothetical protein